MAMADPISFKVDTKEFDETLRRYRELSAREPKKITDTKAFFIARRAVLETPKADKNEIKNELGRIMRVRAGQTRLRLRTVKRFSRWGLEIAVPLAALIINARRGKGRGLYGPDMAEAIKSMLAARLRSVGFLKSGWLPAIRTLVSLADTRGAPRQERGPEQIGAAKGRAVPAQPGWRARTIIENSASTRRDRKSALYQYGEPALQRAFAAETASMKEYIERKLREAAQVCGIKTS